MTGAGWHAGYSLLDEQGKGGPIKTLGDPFGHTCYLRLNRASYFKFWDKLLQADGIQWHHEPMETVEVIVQRKQGPIRVYANDDADRAGETAGSAL